MPISKLGQRRQVVIPKDICENLGLETGDFVEIIQDGGRVVEGEDRQEGVGAAAVDPDRAQQVVDPHLEPC